MKKQLMMRQIFKNKFVRIALRAGICFLLCIGMYLGAVLIANFRFDRKKSEADSLEIKEDAALFYYNALSAEEQLLYGALSESVEHLDDETEWIPLKADGEMLSRAVSAYLLDHPGVFYLDVAQSKLQIAAHSVKIVLTYDALATARMEQLNAALEKLTADIDAEDMRSAASILLQRLVSVCTYPLSDSADAKIGATAYDALVLGTSDGRGYALAYQLLCDTVGIPCETVIGVSGDTPHAWNMVTLDGVTGYTDVMWCDIPDAFEVDDAEAAPTFHGYEFLSYDEILLDHTPNDDTLCVRGDTENYYEYHGIHAEDATELPDILERLLTEARKDGTGEIAISVGVDMTDYQLEEYLHDAIAAANTVTFDGTVPYLRTVNRIYHASETRCAVTVRLFYEENEDARKS